jgi:16S rRNA (guanine966-N2)-methyltransferase
MRTKHGGQSLRIIGGRWRGRNLRFPPVEGLRPTPDRVRETLFNWLQGRMDGARCLDLFAGSGALGLEAASRGATEVVMVDRARRVVAALRDHIALLAPEGERSSCAPSSVLRSIQADVLDFLRGAGRPFDLVFLDPPYRQGALAKCCPLLEHNGWLSPRALVYLEAESELATLPLPPNWEILRTRKAGQVGYHLAQRQP